MDKNITKILEISLKYAKNGEEYRDHFRTDIGIFPGAPQEGLSLIENEGTLPFGKTDVLSRKPGSQRRLKCKSWMAQLPHTEWKYLMGFNKCIALGFFFFVVMRIFFNGFYVRSAMRTIGARQMCHVPFR